jgi:hypothetical protein
MRLRAVVLSLLAAGSGVRAQPAPLSTEPAAEVVRGELDLDGDGAPDLVIETTLLGSACLGCPLTVGRLELHTRPGVAVLSTGTRLSPRLLHPASGERIGTQGTWSNARHPLAYATFHYDEGRLTVHNDAGIAAENVVLGVRIAGPRATRYGWARLTARWEAREVRPGWTVPYPVLTLHASALGAPGAAVRAGERP